MSNSATHQNHYVIVGGVAGGATAAAKLRRDDEHARITLIERGSYLSFANCGLPYFIGGEITDRSKLLLMTPESFWDTYRIEARVNSEVTAIDTRSKEVTLSFENKVETLSYTKLLLAQGARPLVPPLPGVDSDHVFTLRNVPDMDRIHHWIQTHKPKNAVIVGAGFIGLEMAEAFIHRGIMVHLIEMAPHILPTLSQDMAAHFSSKILSEYGDMLSITTGTAVSAIYADRVSLGDSGDSISADMILLSAGVRPEVELAQSAGLEIGVTGGIVVNSQMRTANQDIYAVGDAAQTINPLTGGHARIPLAGPANRQGRIAAINMAGGHANYGGAQGTAIVRMGSTVAGSTGLSPSQATKANMKFMESTTFDNSHAGYYPGAEGMLTRLIFQPGTGKILGAQVVGGEGVDKRIDVFATAIKAGMSVEDLEEIDLAYAPPFGSANDPINVAGFVATHHLKGEVELSTNPEELMHTQLIDVRNPSELASQGYISGAINIPVSELRDRLYELDPARKTVVYCQKGLRGYLAYQILKAAGFTQLANIPGGFIWARNNGYAINTV